MKKELGQFDHLSLDDILKNSTENAELTRNINKEISKIQNLMNFTLRSSFKDLGNSTPNGVNLAPNNILLKEIFKSILEVREKALRLVKEDL